MVNAKIKDDPCRARMLFSERLRASVSHFLLLVSRGAALWLACFAALSLPAETPQKPMGEARAKARDAVQAALRAAQEEANREPASVDAVWKLGRAYFDAAEFPDSKQEQAALAHRGMAVCARAVSMQSNCAAAHYYLGLNLGQLARTKGLGALKLVNEMVGHFQRALKLDERFDNAGPHRNLGYLYRDAPGWISVGDKAKARHHLQKAVELAPTFPENRLALLEGRVQWGELDTARRELRELEQLWPSAKERLTGPIWSMTWVDWEQQLAKLRSKIYR